MRQEKGELTNCPHQQKSCVKEKHTQSCVKKNTSKEKHTNCG